MRSQRRSMATTKVRPERRSESAALSERLLDVNEAAAALAVKPATLYQWAYQRRIHVVKLFGPRGALRFRAGDIRALIARSVRPVLGESDGRGLDLQ
jgi:predicted DNA-binding transcriptional regulator AlpA